MIRRSLASLLIAVAITSCRSAATTIPPDSSLYQPLESIGDSSYQPIVAGTPGLRTVKNFIATALMPAGTTLYVFGGGWDRDDTGSGPQSTAIGLAPEWIAFFNAQDSTYNYKSDQYYPHQGINQCYYAGLDCSGFVGWALYNVINTTSGAPGYVCPSSRMAYTLADAYRLGSFTTDADPTDFRPGDIVSINGHVWICLGRCDDGSILILHSTVNNGEGSGVQLSGLSDNPDCMATQLARQYMARLNPVWAERYDVATKPVDTYTAFTAPYHGRLTWLPAASDGCAIGVLADPDGYLKMSAPEILSDLFPD